MPPAYVSTIREEIYYEYAKLVSRFAYGSLERGEYQQSIDILDSKF
jgi:hypothetical protein